MPTFSRSDSRRPRAEWLAPVRRVIRRQVRRHLVRYLGPGTPRPRRPESRRRRPMRDFDYVAPTSLAEATAFLARANGRARILAGGTDLLVQLRERLRDAELIVDVKRIPELME